MPLETISLSLVIPCYNEKDNLPPLLKRIQDLVSAVPGLEVVLVDNGSTDGSDRVLDDAIPPLALGEQLVRVRVPENLGYGYGILSGLAAARGDVLSWTHADLQTDLADVERALQAYRADGRKPFVKGHRMGRRFAERFFSWGMELYASARLGLRLREINAQPKLFSREFYQKHLVEGAPFDFSLDLWALYQAAKGGTTVSIPVDFSARLHGEAKGGGGRRTRWKLVKRTFAYIDNLASRVSPHRGRSR